MCGATERSCRVWCNNREEFGSVIDVRSDVMNAPRVWTMRRVVGVIGKGGWVRRCSRIRTGVVGGCAIIGGDRIFASLGLDSEKIDSEVEVYSVVEC